MWMALLESVGFGDTVSGFMERLERRCLLSAALAALSEVAVPTAVNAYEFPARLSKHHSTRTTTFNFYEGAGTTTNAISAATTGSPSALAASNPAPPAAPALPVATNFTTSDVLTSNPTPTGFSIADLVLNEMIPNESIVIGTNSNVAGIFGTGPGIHSVTNSGNAIDQVGDLESIFAF